MPNRLLIFLTGVLSCAIAVAADNDRQKPLHLRADSIEINQKSGASLYRGHVLLTQGSLHLSAARAAARQQGNQVQSVSAEGKPVRFRQLPEGSSDYLVGEAGQVQYQVPSQLVDMQQDVVVKHGRDDFRANVAHYDIQARTLTAEGDAKQRVYAALVPRTQLSPDAKDSP